MKENYNYPLDLSWSTTEMTEVLSFFNQVEKFYEEGRSIYTWFAQRAKTSKLNNSGWRIDYWLVSNRLAQAVKVSEPLDSGERLDHVPILLEFEL